MKGEATHGLAARLDGRLVGIAHYMFQTSIWFDDVCYLADLFVDETVRGQGAARALIEAVAAAGRPPRLPPFLLVPQQGKPPARIPHDQVARFAGFLRDAHSLA